MTGKSTKIAWRDKKKKKKQALLLFPTNSGRKKNYFAFPVQEVVTFVSSIRSTFPTNTQRRGNFDVSPHSTTRTHLWELFASLQSLRGVLCHCTQTMPYECTTVCSILRAVCWSGPPMLYPTDHLKKKTLKVIFTLSPPPTPSAKMNDSSSTAGSTYCSRRVVIKMQLDSQRIHSIGGGHPWGEDDVALKSGSNNILLGLGDSAGGGNVYYCTVVGTQYSRTYLPGNGI